MSTFRPWQFFVLAALLVATVGVFLSRGTSPANIIFISVTIGAAALAGMAVYRMLLPLVAPEAAEITQMAGGRTRVAIEREKSLVLRSIKELEFDRAMDKISEQDYEDMVARLRARAVRLIRQLDAGQTGYREIIERELASRVGRSAASKVEARREEERDSKAPGACASCGTTNEPDARFCKQCGVKLAAVLLLAFALVLPSLLFAQIDPRQMSGIPRPDGNLADGTITVRVIRGTFANNVVEHPVELRTGDQVQAVKTDANGRATFRAPSAGTTVRASTVVDGEQLQSQDFPAPSVGGVAVMLVAGASGAAATRQPVQPGSVSLGPGSRLVVDLENDTLQVYYLLEVLNPGTYPVTPPAPVIIDLPSGAAGAGAIQGSSAQVVVRGSRVTVTPPFQPGATAVNIAFTMPYSGGGITIDQKLPVPMPEPSVVMRKIGAMQIQSPQLTTQQEMPIEGRTYVMASGPAIGSNGTLAFDVLGLPHHSRVPRTLAGTIATLIVIIGLVASFNGADRSAAAARRKQLENRREKAFAELVKLEEQKRGGKIDAARHQNRRASLIAQLERIYGELDSAGPAAGSGPRRGSRDRDPGGGDEGLAA
jgi:hypothetical protein